jgi:choline-sulfatase
MALLSGLWPHETGIFHNGQPLPSDVPTFAHGFGAAGYHTALIGRMHIVGTDQHHGFEEKLGQDVTASTLGGGRFPQIQGLHAGIGPIGFARSGSGDSAYLHYDDHITTSAVQWLADRKDDDRPFLLVVGLALPHCPFVAPRELYDGYRHRVGLPAVPVDDDAAAHPVHQAMRRKQVDGGVAEEDLLRSLAAYHALVEVTDRNVGRIVAALDAGGLGNRTLLVYTSDHGESAGEHGLWHKSQLLDGAARIPMLVRWPGRVPTGGTCVQNVNLLDLGPTLLDAAGCPALPEVSGRSFRCLWEGRIDPWDNRTFSEIGGRHGPAFGRMVKRDDWKLIQYHGHPPLLFDLQADPGETRNLADEPAHATRLAALAEELARDWDPAWVTEGIRRWAARNGLLFKWYASRHRPDPELYAGPPGCNRLDDVPFTPEPDERIGQY